MPNDRNCPVLTDKGKDLINHNIKDALHEIIVYGVPKNDLAGKEELSALLQSDKATKEQLDKFKIVEKKPLVAFFDIDKKLTVRVNLSYDDLIRKDVTIEGIGILGAEGDIVSLFPDHAILDNPQANLEALIKIHSVVGEPGEVEYYTGTFLTREEYEAAKVPMIEEVTRRTHEVVDPQIKTVIQNFKDEGKVIIDAQQDNFEQLKAKYERELQEIKEQATQDLTGMQDYIAKLHRLGRLEQATIHMYDRLCALYKNLYSMFDQSILLFKKADEERCSFGDLKLFSGVLPRDYIYFNKWYLISEYVCFYRNFARFMVTSSDGTKFMVRWQPYTEANKRVPLDGLYIKASLETDNYDYMEQYPQKLPAPYSRLQVQERPRSRGSIGISSYWYWDKFISEKQNWVEVQEKEGTPSFDRGGQNDWFHNYVYVFNMGHDHGFYATINSPTYTASQDAPADVESTKLVLGIKANLSFNLGKELDKIMDKAFVDC